MGVVHVQQVQLPYMAPGGMVPFMAPPATPHMAPSFMMLPPHAIPSLPGQPFMATPYGFAPAAMAGIEPDPCCISCKLHAQGMTLCQI